MGRIIVVITLASALFLSGAWSLGLLDDYTTKSITEPKSAKKETKPKEQLGNDLYAERGFDPIPASKQLASEPTVIYGTMNAIEQQEVPSLVNGEVMFIGQQVEDEAFLVGGSAAFLAEPYYVTRPVFTGKDSFVKFYRRLHEGETIGKDQMVAMIEPAEALGEVLAKINKIEIAKSELASATYGEEEGRKRYYTQIELWAKRSTSREEYGAAELTFQKLKYERETKDSGVAMAMTEKWQADIKLRLHEIRPRLPYERSVLKTIVRQLGFSVKQLDPVVVVQNLSKLQAEALIEEQYFAPLRNRPHITATIEPTIMEKPLHEFDALDVTSVAVAKDLKIVSGSEDSSVNVWLPNVKAPVLKLETDDAVRAVACTPKDAEKNLCLAGCSSGSLYLWDLDEKEPTAVLIARDKAHGGDTSISALAFSPDGKYFATGASDGSIILWNTADGSKRYAFTPENGVEKCHEDAVTSLHFTPQCRLISAGRDRTLRVWKLKELGAHADGKAILNRKGNVPNLGVSQDGRYMLFDRDQTLQMLSVEKRTLQQTLHVPVNSTPFETLSLFSPDGSLILTAGAPEGRMQLWRTPEGDTRSFEVRQFATKERQSVTSAAFAPNGSFAVSASGQKIYLWTIPSAKEVSEHRIERVRMTLKTQQLDSSTRNTRVGFEVFNEFSERYPNGRFEVGRPVTIVIE
jgi:WD40 repeat protein